MFAYIISFFKGFVNILGEMSPYLLLGFFFAGMLKVLVPTSKIQKYFGGNRIKSSIYAALFGVPLPLCSCGVIPTGMSFYKNGASKSSAVSFLISTPQTGVDSILVTYSLLGLPFAIIRPIVALITGVFGGVFTGFVDKDDAKNQVTTINQESSNVMSFITKIKEIFRYGFVEFLQDISKWLIIGLLAAAVITVVIPNDFFANLGLSPVLQMLIILVASIPLYICATASVPLAAVLILKGISPGAALVLLMAGPATNAATITMIGKVMGRKALFAYLFSIITGALLSGFIIDHLLPAHWFAISQSEHLMHSHEMMPYWLKIASAVTLIALIINGYIQRYFVNRSNDTHSNQIFTMATKTILVEGMTCNHCKNTVENNLKKLDFIKDASVDLPTGKVVLEGDEINLVQVQEIIDGLGYQYQKEV